VSGELHAPAALAQTKEPLVRIGEEAKWAPEPPNSQPCRDSNPPIIQPVSQRATADIKKGNEESR